MTVTVTQVASTTSATQLAAADTTRTSLTIANTDSYRLYWLLGTGTPSASNYSDYLDPDESVSFTGSDIEQAVQGVWAGDGSGYANVTKVTAEQLAGAGTTTILGIVQSVCKRPLGIEPPDTLFSSSDRTAQELAEVANAAVDMIVRAYSWRSLVQRATYTGDGSTQDFDLPDDFEKMPSDMQVWSSDNQAAFQPVRSLDDWMAMDVRNFNPGANAWIIFGGQIHFTPALDDAEVAQHYYQSTAAVQPETGTATARFSMDTDTFRLNDELLKKAIIYLWKQDKGHPYAEFMNDYEVLKEKLILRDKGARVIMQGSARYARGASIAYPLTVPGGT